MDSVRQCMICGKGMGRFTCSMCGMVVCDKCYDASTGLCIACKGKKV